MSEQQGEIPAEVRDVKELADAAIRRKDIDRDELIRTFRDIEARSSQARERLEGPGGDASPREWRWPWQR